MSKFKKLAYLLVFVLIITSAFGCKTKSRTKPGGGNNTPGGGNDTPGGGSDIVIVDGIALSQAAYYNKDFTTDYNDWELVNGATAEISEGVLKITPGAQEGIALKLKESVWQSIVGQMGGSADSYYVEMLIRPTSAPVGSNKNIGIATNITSDNQNFYYAGFNGNGRMQAGKATGNANDLKGYQNTGDGTTVNTEKDFVYYKWRYEYNNGVINFYSNDLFMGKNGALANYTPGENYSGTIGVYTCGASFEVASVRIGRLDENLTKLIIETADTNFALLWGKYLRRIKSEHALGIKVGDTAEFTITATDASGQDDTWNATSTNPQVLSLSATSGNSGDKLTVTAVGVGTATIKITNGSNAYSAREITFEVEDAMGFVPDQYGDISGKVYPNVGANAAYTDGEFMIAFDTEPQILEQSGAIYIYNYETGEVSDTIYFANDRSSVHEFRRGAKLNEDSQRIRIDGNNLYFTPHFENLAYTTKYYVVIANQVIEGTLNGKTFTGFSPNDKTWYFTTKAAPVIAGSTISVDGSQDSTADFRTIQAALSYAMANKLDDVEIQIEPGTYRELLSYKYDANITLRGMGTAKYGQDVVIEYKNAEKINSGTDNRGLTYFSTNKTLNLVNLTLKNAADKATYGQAETIYFNNDNGTLIAFNCSFISEQDTILTKGVNWFYDCYIEGNTDFIWGYASACVFEVCEIHLVSDGSYIFQARSPAGSRGYVLLNCDLITDTAGESYFARSGGDSNYFDNVSIINCRISGAGTLQSWHESPLPNPNPGTAIAGWKQYGLTDGEGNPITVTSPTAYTLTEAEYKDEVNGWDTSEKIFGKTLVLP